LKSLIPIIFTLSGTVWVPSYSWQENKGKVAGLPSPPKRKEGSNEKAKRRVLSLWQKGFLLTAIKKRSKKKK